MTTEEKLQHFYDVSVREAEAEAEAMLETYKQELEQQFQAYKKTKDQEASVLMKAEADRASREINKALSSSQLDIKRSFTRKQNTLKSQLFEEVKKLVQEFMNTSDYLDFLTAKVQAAREFAGEDQLTVCLAPGDADKIPEISARTGMELQISEQDFIGGIQARIPHKNILIDNSFLSAFEYEQHNFTFEGGLTYE